MSHVFMFLFFFFFCPSSVRAGDIYSLLSKLLGEREDVVHVHKYNPSEVKRAQAELLDSIMQKKDLPWANARLGYSQRGLVRDRVHKFQPVETTVRPASSRIMPGLRPATVVAKTDKTGGFMFLFKNRRMGLRGGESPVDAVRLHTLTKAQSINLPSCSNPCGHFVAKFIEATCCSISLLSLRLWCQVHLHFHATWTTSSTAHHNAIALHLTPM